MRKILILVVLGLTVAACQKTSNVVINTQQPVNARLTYFDRDSVDIASYIASNSTSPLTLSDSFQVALSQSNSFKYLEVQAQNDSGIVLNDLQFTHHNGDIVAGRINTVVQNVYVGNLSLTFKAYNNEGSSGNYAVKILPLYDSAPAPPVIDSVSAPDSLMVGQDTVKVTLTAYVSDQAGPGNIAAVYFNVTKPDGQPSTGNPFRMYDDGGKSGEPGDIDPVANDGHFTLGISLPPGTTTGRYVFSFYALDKSGVKSKTIDHPIVVY